MFYINILSRVVRVGVVIIYNFDNPASQSTREVTLLFVLMMSIISEFSKTYNVIVVISSCETDRVVVVD